MMKGGRYSAGCLKLTLVATTICAAPITTAAEHRITGSDGDDRLVGTPGADYFVGGRGADVFVINYLSASPDEIADFEPEEGDTIELAFEMGTSPPFRSENFSINRKGVVKVRLGRKQHEVVRLNQTDLRLELDQRKGRYTLKFSRKF